MTTILVTGSNGQLASCIKDIVGEYDGLNFLFTDYQDLDICNLNQVQAFFSENNIDYCINCAAYTAVDLAEEEESKAFDINVNGAKNLALVCKKQDVVLIHISTDFVFSGEKDEAYTEMDKPNPISVYGSSKLKGEVQVHQILEQYFILRTSWLYSEHGNNFMKTMIRLSEEKETLSVVSDQKGTPTYAGDLAQFILNIIKIESKKYGVYHYSNLGEISWFDFAKAIFDEKNIKIKLAPIKTKDYPTLASRPMYSVLDKTKAINSFKTTVPHWRDSLKLAISRLE